ncbi:MAG: YfjI family protein [Dehalococcoidia bacterium]|nr:YfjI family protein [Dehalococcoidia bacterium]
MARKVENWLLSYLEMVRQTEPAQRFHAWSAITVVGALLGRKCYVRFGPEVISPNLFTILVGPPGIRKDPAINYATAMARDIGSDVLVMAPDAITKQQLFNVMERAQKTVIIDGRPLQHSTVLIVAEELVVFLEKDDPERLALLCKLYDNRPTFRYETKHSGNNYLVNPGLWILGATTPDWIENTLTQLAIGGGAAARMIFVFSDRKGMHIPLTKMPPFDHDLRERLLDDLAEIADLAGEFVMTDSGKEVYEKWYGEAQGSAVWGNSDYEKQRPDDLRLRGFWAKIPTMVCKVAMILSVMESSSKEIEGRHVAQAIKLFLQIVPDMPRAFGSLGRNVLGPQTEMVRAILRDVGMAKKSYIMRVLRMHINEHDYQRIKMTLLAEKFCIKSYDQSGEEVLVYCDGETTREVSPPETVEKINGFENNQKSKQ